MSDTEDPERGGGGSGWSLWLSAKAYGMQMDIGSVCHRGWWTGTMTMIPCSSLPAVLVPLKCGILINPAETDGWARSIRAYVEECIAWSQVPYDPERPDPVCDTVFFLDCGFTFDLVAGDMQSWSEGICEARLMFTVGTPGLYTISAQIGIESSVDVQELARFCESLDRVGAAMRGTGGGG